ncbi:MAG: AMP-binding protein [Lamprobacter sp.]|uniref:AMP-binding protein n=1 Tax=Lamprobacter sp. TaxID=3100796 RepID=UPI002B25EC76|nr:AMP-binding protein [Lamprobacter sp.]MEA3642915.1 AMP-binding protein [Lamprobacter sp.]
MSGADFLARAAALSQSLPANAHLINLCNDRYLFALTFAAALMRGAISLFPPNRLAATCHEIAKDYPDALCVTDSPVEGLTLPTQQITAPPAMETPAMPFIEPTRQAFIAFSSGSTGQPRPQPKRWGDLVGCARAAARRFGFGPQHSIIATVPPQHMYGLELSILLPFTLGARVAAVRPFYPADIRAALTRSASPRLLVTTPVHLAACVESGLDWPAVEQVISATAPLSDELAQHVEAVFSTQVREIYGSTESGSIASRETCRDRLWHWYDSVRPHRDADGLSVSADFIHGRVALADVIEIHPDGRFLLLGRAADMIKVGGKRASLANLNAKLNAIEGVRDGVFIAPDPDGDPVGRLAVVAVAPGLDRESIIHGLAGHIDPVFYPRRILLVARLPRNEAGKLPREALLQLLRHQAGNSSDAH